MNISGQLQFLSQLDFTNELSEDLFPLDPIKGNRFFLRNRSFGSGDAEFLYQFVRHVKPKRIIEIGSGFSTTILSSAHQKNISEDNGSLDYSHVCIEPFEMPWLEELPVTVIRSSVENIELDFFSSLNANDLLFIDSTHMIKPSGDILTEYLHILPALNPGTYIHIHDIFTPFNYPSVWINDDVRFGMNNIFLRHFFHTILNLKLLLLSTSSRTIITIS